MSAKRSLACLTGLLLPLAAALTGCASGPSVHVQRLTEQRFPPAAYVQVLSAPPQQPYTAVARLSAQGAAGQDPAQLLALLQAQAAQLGANAIVVQDRSRSLPPPAPAFNPAGGQYQQPVGQTLPDYTALAIHLLPPSPAPVASAPVPPSRP